MAEQPAYDGHDRERRAAERREPVQGVLPRSDFERDRARVLHSSALRRLAAKTQVVGVGVDDFPRNRLTHSLECAQIGRSVAEAVGCDPDLVEAACLAHDLGHPPFGHTGEQVLDAISDDCGGFEGNAQTFRILTRLEAKVLTADGASAGLNLTRAVLDATVKYPWPREQAAVRAGVRKFGVYVDDLPTYEWVRRPSDGDADPGRRRCMEAQVMDWADDVAYSVHDVEDGIHSGHIDVGLIRDDGDERAELSRLAAEVYSPETPDHLAGALDVLLAEPVVAELPPFDGTLASQVALKRMTSVLISDLMATAVLATREAAGGPARRYGAGLIVPREARARCALMKAMAARYVMHRAESLSLRSWEQDLLADLVSMLWDGAPESLVPSAREQWHAAADDGRRRRVVVDAVASMTDTSAVKAHARLSALRAGKRRGRPATRVATPRPSTENGGARMVGRDRRFVIVGGGLAGAMAAATLRESGFEGEVVLLGAEPVRPYERPALSKGGLATDSARAAAARKGAFVHEETYYRAYGIDLRLGTGVWEFDPLGREIRIEGGEILYDRLLLATGSAPIRLSVPGADLRGVHYLRTMADAEALDRVLTSGARVLVVGAGWIGLEVAAAARTRGCAVTVVDPAAVPLGRVLGPEVGGVFADLHREHGVDLRMSTGVTGFDSAATGAVGAAALDTGETLPVDVVVVGIGVRPVTALAEAAGLEVADGIVVDERLATSDPSVWAAGDCARMWSPFYGRRIRVEHWANARNSGIAAARSMLAESPSGAEAYDRLPYFYSDQYDVGMEFSGWFDRGGYTSVVFRGDTARREFLAFYVVDDGSGGAGRVVAAMNVNVWDVVSDLQAVVRSAAPIDYGRLADPAVPLDRLAAGA